MIKISSKYLISSDDIDITCDDVHWRAEDSTSDDILFYRVGSSEEDKRRATDRLEKASFKYLFINEDIGLSKSEIIIVKDKYIREVQKIVCDFLYPINTSLVSVGVTGTNGKTSVVWMISQYLNDLGCSNISLGTLGLYINGVQSDNFNLTSPDYIDFRKTISSKNTSDIKYFITEVSSHALDQERFYHYQFDYTVWTSFSQDHLDYHLTMENYFNSKMRLVNKSKSPTLIHESQKHIYSKLSGNQYELVASYQMDTENKLLNRGYNQVNASLCLAIVEKVEQISTNVEMKLPPGRCEFFKAKNNSFILDYAHTSDALENVIKNIKEVFSSKKIICVFGCGGNRDKTKRTLMGQVATKFADFVYITSDNPRDEDPASIIRDITSQLQVDNFKTETDRKTAIELAYKENKDAIILVAGKGHEDYLEVKGKRLPYSDIKTIKELDEN